MICAAVMVKIRTSNSNILHIDGKISIAVVVFGQIQRINQERKTMMKNCKNCVRYDVFINCFTLIKLLCPPFLSSCKCFLCLVFPSYRHLDLSNNSLTTLPKDSVTTAPLLETLILQANPWSCDCRMNWLHTWSLTHPG